MKRRRYVVTLTVYASREALVGENAQAREAEIEDLVQDVVREIEPVDVDVARVRETR